MEWNISKPKLPLENRPSSTSRPWWNSKCCLTIDRFNWTVTSSLCFLASYPGPCAECLARGRGVYVYVVFNITVRETTALLVAYSRKLTLQNHAPGWLSPYGTRADSDHIHQHALIASYMSRFCAGARAASCSFVPINARHLISTRPRL